MPIEHSSEMDQKGRSKTRPRRKPTKAKTHHANILREGPLTEPKPGQLGANVENRTDEEPQNKEQEYVERVNEEAVNDPAQAMGKIRRSRKPDKRDEKKVDRLAAPDWRSDQPLPSAQTSVDPRGANTPEELFEKKSDSTNRP